MIQTKSTISSLISFLCWFLLSLGLTLPLKAEEPLVFLEGQTMGTTYHIKFYGLPPAPLHEKVDQILEKVNDQMSTYRPESEISQFNQAKGGQWVSVSTDMIKVAKLAKKIHDKTDGAFEPTIGKLVNLWGFGPQYIPEKIPDSAILRETRNNVGLEKVEIREAPPAMRRLNEDIYLDFSGIAKGYGVDVVAEYLESLGLKRYMVEIGGEIRAKGLKAKGQSWSIGIENPSAPPGHVVKAIYPHNNGLATSGDYRNYFEIDGKRYSHILDPRTGFPIEHKLASVTVVASTSAEADGLATAFMVLGADKGMEIAARKGIAALFLVRENHEFIEKVTEAFKPYLSPLKESP